MTSDGSHDNVPPSPDPTAGMWLTIEHVFTEVWNTFGDTLERPEIWLNPADWEDLGKPERCACLAWERGPLPARTSIGVPAGTVKVFCRKRLKYLPLRRAPAR